MNLEEFFSENPNVAVACSGGVDSAFLLYQAKHHARGVKAYFVKSDFQPEFEQEDAVKLCEQIGAELAIIHADVLLDTKVMDNPPDRCYYCKKRILEAVKEHAMADGFPILLEGTNASDDIDDRPGVRALREYGFFSPLRACGYTKDRIRQEAKEAGLFVHDKPAYACLATRIPTGRKITKELLCKVEKAEEAMFSLGFADFRVRVYGEAAKIQIRESDILDFLNKREEIVQKLSPFFEEVLLDCKIWRKGK